jgi:hypothetical protein
LHNARRLLDISIDVLTTTNDHRNLPRNYDLQGVFSGTERIIQPVPADRMLPAAPVIVGCVRYYFPAGFPTTRGQSSGEISLEKWRLNVNGVPFGDESVQKKH